MLYCKSKDQNKKWKLSWINCYDRQAENIVRRRKKNFHVSRKNHDVFWIESNCFLREQLFSIKQWMKLNRQFSKCSMCIIFQRDWLAPLKSKQQRRELLYWYKRAKTSRITVLNILKLYLYLLVLNCMFTLSGTRQALWKMMSAQYSTSKVAYSAWRQNQYLVVGLFVPFSDASELPADVKLKVTKKKVIMQLTVYCKQILKKP